MGKVTVSAENCQPKKVIVRAVVSDLDRLCRILAVDINNLVFENGGPMLSQTYLNDYVRVRLIKNLEVSK